MNKTKMETPDSIQISGDGISIKDLRIKTSGKITMSKTLANSDTLNLRAGIRAVPIEKVPIPDRLAWVQNQNRVSSAAESILADRDGLLQMHMKRDENGNAVHPLDGEGNPIRDQVALVDPPAYHRAYRELMGQEGTVHLRLFSEDLFLHLSSETPHPTQEGKMLPAVSSDVLAALMPLFDVEE